MSLFPNEDRCKTGVTATEYPFHQLVTSRTIVSRDADYIRFFGFPYLKEGLLNAGCIFSYLGGRAPLDGGGLICLSFRSPDLGRQVDWPLAGFARQPADLLIEVSLWLANGIYHFVVR